MELTHTFTVPVPPAQAFAVLQDIERIGPCMPGATIESVDGRSFTGSVKVKIGPIKVTYQGQAEYAALDEEALTATIDARGKESRGTGTANATVRAALREVPDGTEVQVVTDLAVTGKPAQFGRGVMEEVGQKLINQFAECLSTKLAEDSDTGADGGTDDHAAGAAVLDGAPTSTDGSDQSGGADAAGGAAASPPDATGNPAASTTTAATTSAPPRDAGPARGEAEAIDLLDVAGGSVAKRVAPVVGGALVLALLWKLIRR